MKRYCMLAVIVTFCGFLMSPPARAQEEKAALAVIPDDVLGFVSINRLEQANSKILALAKQMKIPLPFSPLDFGRKILGLEKGLNTKGSLTLALHAGLNGDVTPIPILYIPVTNYKEFVGQFKSKDAGGGLTEIRPGDTKEYVVGERGKFAVVAPREHAEILKKALASTKSVDSWAKPLHQWLVENDLAAVMTPRGLKLVSALARKGLEEAKGKFADLPPEAKFMETFVENLIGFVKSVESDVTHVALGGRLDPAGNMHVDGRALFAKNSGFATRAKAVKALEGGPLTGLPAGPFAFAFGGAVPENFMKTMTEFSVEMVKIAYKDLTADQLKKLQQYYEHTTKGVRGIGTVLGSGAKSLFGSAVVIMHVDNATQYVDNYEKAIKEINALAKDLKIPGLGSAETRRTKVSGVNVLEVVTDLTANLPNVGDFEKALFEKMFGPGGKMTVSVAPLSAKTVVFRYSGADTLKDLLMNTKKKGSGLASDPDIVKTAALLPPGAQWAFYVSPRGTIEFVNEALGLFGAPIHQLPAFAKTPPVGLAFKCSEAGLQAHLVVPGPVLEHVAEFVGKIKQADQ